MGLKSKADLQLTKNKLTDTELEIDKLTRQKQDKETQLKQQEENIKNLREEIREKALEIVKKDNTIGEKED